MMISTEWVDEVTEVVGDVTREAYRHMGANTCVHSSRALFNVLRREGIRSTPTAVGVLAMDAVALAALNAGEVEGGLPMAGFAYYVGPGMSKMPRDPNIRVVSGEAFNAHMVITVEPAPGADLMVADVTAPQFHRPQDGVSVLRPVTFPAEPGSWNEGEPGVIPLPDGGGILYQRVPDSVPESRSWKTSSAWTTEAKTMNAIVEECLRRVRLLDSPRMVCRNG